MFEKCSKTLTRVARGLTLFSLGTSSSPPPPRPVVNSKPEEGFSSVSTCATSLLQHILPFCPEGTNDFSEWSSRLQELITLQDTAKRPSWQWSLGPSVKSVARRIQYRKEPRSFTHLYEPEWLTVELDKDLSDFYTDLNRTLSFVATKRVGSNTTGVQPVSSWTVCVGTYSLPGLYYILRQIWGGRIDIRESGYLPR